MVFRTVVVFSSCHIAAAPGHEDLTNRLIVSLQACASCGCAVGTQVVQVLGAELPASRWAELAERTAEIIERDAARAAETK